VNFALELRIHHKESQGGTGGIGFLMKNGARWVQKMGGSCSLIINWKILGCMGMDGAILAKGGPTQAHQPVGMVVEGRLLSQGC